jgi:hypothetical protein
VGADEPDKDVSLGKAAAGIIITPCQNIERNMKIVLHSFMLGDGASILQDVESWFVINGHVKNGEMYSSCTNLGYKLNK